MSELQPNKVVANLKATMNHPAERTYAVLSLATLGIVAVLFFLFYFSVFGPIVLLMVGLSGVVFRWSSAPIIGLLAAIYFLIFPFGVPMDAGQRNTELFGSAFQLQDMLTVLAILAHLVCLYRLQTLQSVGMPHDAPKTFVKPKMKPTTRKVPAISDQELFQTTLVLVIVLFVGQIIWFILTETTVLMDDMVSVRFTLIRNNGSPDRETQRAMVYFPHYLYRLIAYTLFMTALIFSVWLGLRCYRWHRMNRSEAAAILMDESWRNARRDYNRPESWRAWMKNKLNRKRVKRRWYGYLIPLGLPIVLFLLYLMILNCMGAFYVPPQYYYIVEGNP